MSNTRRNILTFMGLAGATSAAMATEELTWRVEGEDNLAKIPNLTRPEPARIADALQKIVDGLRSGEVEVNDVRIETKLGGVNNNGKNGDYAWLYQTLALDLAILDKV